MSLRISILSLLLLVLSPGAFASDPVDRQGVRTIAVLGDSLTAGYGLAREDAFPAQLEAALLDNGINARVINSGISGDTSAGGLSRIDWVLADNPDFIIIALGANDALRGFEPDETRKNLAAILEKVLAEDIKVLLAGLKAPRNFGSSYYTKFDRIYAELAEKYDVPLYPFFLEGVATVSDLNQDDGIHPNREGVKVMVQNILPFVIKNL